MYCKRCGAQVAEGGAFCARCGTPTGMRAEREETDVSAPLVQDSANEPEDIASESVTASPLRYVEVAIVALLVPAAFLLPVFTLGAVWAKSLDVSVIDLIASLVESGGPSEAMTCGLVVCGLLVVGCGASVASAALCLKRPLRGHVLWSWGMAIYGLGIVVVRIIFESTLVSQLDDLIKQLSESAAHDTLSLGTGVFVAVIGGIMCGVVDLVRSQRH